jgi:hypothetical protein
MKANFDLEELDHCIRAMKASAEQLASLGEDFPALSRNTARILASIKMLEINICDVAEILKQP